MFQSACWLYNMTNEGMLCQSVRGRFAYVHKPMLGSPLTVANMYQQQLIR